MSLLLVVGVSIALGAGPEPGVMTEVCPFDDTHVSRPAFTVGEQTGLRLDLRAVGRFLHPDPLARCPRCQYVPGLRIPDGELARVRALLSSKEYQEEARRPSNHALRALIMAALKPDPGEVAFEWLRASWELEGTSGWKHATERALAEFIRLTSATMSPDDESALERRRTAQLMQVELLRRLARFPEARAALDKWADQPEMQRGAYVTLLATERSLIEKKQDAPQPFPSMPPLDPRSDDPALIAATQLKGFAAFDADFIIERADFGAFNMLPDSLHLALLARKPRALDSIWWWNFTKDGVPQFDWTQLLAAHARAEQLVGRNKWLAEWKAAGPSRRVELQLAGLESNTEMDFAFFVQPAWEHAGFTKPPVVELLLREKDSNPCANVFLDAGGGGIVTMVFECTPNHWVTAKSFSYHPKDNPPTYLRVSADGRWEMREMGAKR